MRSFDALVKSVDNILLMIEDDLNAAFFAGLVTNIEPCESSIFDRIVSKLNAINGKRSVAIICSEASEADHVSMDLLDYDHINMFNRSFLRGVNVYVCSDEKMAELDLNGIDVIVHANLCIDLATFRKRFTPFRSTILSGIQSVMDDNVAKGRITSIMLSGLYNDQELYFMTDFIELYFKNDTLPSLYQYFLKVSGNFSQITPATGQFSSVFPILKPI